MENQSLACGHVHHAACINEYILIKRFDTHLVPCPICKPTARCVAGMEEQLERVKAERRRHSDESEVARVEAYDTLDTPSAPGPASPAP